jgi:hypothetical protein
MRRRTPVIERATLAVCHFRQSLLLRGTIAVQLVGEDEPRHVHQPPQPLAEELLRSFLVPTALHQDIEHRAILIDRPPQVVPFASDRETHLVQVPRVARPGPSLPELLRIGLAELAAPLSHRFIRHDHATSASELFHIAVAETEANIEPDGMADALGREARVCARVGWCGSVHHSPKTVYRYEERAFLSRGTMVEG